MERVHLAIVGAGVAGTYIAHEVALARPDWEVVLIERTDRIGGRLRSVAVSGLDHKIELGGMRYLTSHRGVAALIERLGLATHPFDPIGGPERSYLRGRFGGGAADPEAGAAYDLDAVERGRSANELGLEAMENVIPDAARLGPHDFARLRVDGRYRGRRLVDWSLGEALASVRSKDGHRFVADAFAYDSGIRAFNAGDGIEYLLGAGDPTAEARTPDDGMDRIPRELASRLEAAGGHIDRNAEVLAIDAAASGGSRVRIDGGPVIEADRVVLTVPLPALRRIVARSISLQTPAISRLLASVEGFPALKLYLWYDRPWWDGHVAGIRTVTDLPARKVFYTQTHAGRRSALLGVYTDGRHVEPWLALTEGVSDGAPAPRGLLAEVSRQLAILHPDVPAIPDPAGSALMSWGTDPDEVGWTFWRPGVVSDECIELALQPDPSTEIYLAGESFSRSQGWVEGALETAARTVRRILSGEVA